MKHGSNPALVLKKGAWTTHEDILLKNYIEKHGEGKWHLIPTRSGLNRCRKSCRLRWLNYLRPNIKRGDFAEDEVDLILRLHKLLGNRWSLIAGRIPGRTGNDVKNYWNTHILSRSKQQTKEPNNGESLQDTPVTIIKPKPRTFSQTLNMGDNPNIVVHGANNNFNMTSGSISQSNVEDDKINEYLDDLFDDCENEINRKFGWSSFGGTSAESNAINVVEQEDDEINLFDFQMDKFTRDLINSHQL